MPGAGEIKLRINQQRGESLLETLLAMAVVAALAPLAYIHISEMTRRIADIAIAKQIADFRDPMLNFIRMNASGWNKNIQFRLDDADIAGLSGNAAAPYAVYIDKYTITDSEIIDAYSAFHVNDSSLMRNADIVKNIGFDAGLVNENGIAYDSYSSWGVQSDDFASGDIVYRVRLDLKNNDNEKYLYRTASRGQNNMLRDFNLGGFDLYDIAAAAGKVLESASATANFAAAENLIADIAYFNNGADIGVDGASIGIIRVRGDTTGLRNIYAKKFQGTGLNGNWSSGGSVISDKTVVSEKLNVSGNLSVKSGAARTISGIAGMSVHSVYTPYLFATELYFAAGFGMVVSSELIASSAYTPIKLGNWSFPTSSYPKLKSLVLRQSGGEMGGLLRVDTARFDKITASGWRDLEQNEPIAQ
ncbi:MAG: hypothetical protein LBO08_01185 [Rickettsiales bacterium]|nr:hypothetical protein [Rickettsiales bacterium]